jgi:UDP-galactopyranose mutase
MPFALNESTRFISPTKLPEYLAAGRPAVSTPIVDVVRQYANLGGVRIAYADAFVRAIQEMLGLKAGNGAWLQEVDPLLMTMSWDQIWARMSGLINQKRRLRRPMPRVPAPSLPRAKLRVRSAPHITRRPYYDYLIIGAGFAGSVLAERLARDDGARVALVDRRDHIGGNAYDHHDMAGVLVHRYGPHIFHTNSERIVEYLSRFTAWRPYEHRVLAAAGGDLLPVPINRTTVNRFFGLSLSEAEVERFLAERAEPVTTIRTSEDIVLSRVGRELYEAFFRDYTRKQWGVYPDMLDKSVAGRIPVRANNDDRYFGDSFQRMPRDGYTRMFENMLDHQAITLMLGCDYKDVRGDVDYGHLIFTGPIDEYFGHRLGKLPYRSLRFQHETVNRQTFQPVAVVNYPSLNVPYTRITEYKHLTGQVHPQTSISYEFPSAEGDPYYPVPRAENAALYARYQTLADAERRVSFVGRLATYRYYNMDQIVGQALTLYDRLKRHRKTPKLSAMAPAQPDGMTVSREIG